MIFVCTYTCICVIRVNLAADSHSCASAWFHDYVTSLFFKLSLWCSSPSFSLLRTVQISSMNRFAWHVWALFESTLGYIDKRRKLMKIWPAATYLLSLALLSRDHVILQSLALMEYKHLSANLARVLFRRASELGPRHQPVWLAWGWMEWKEGKHATTITREKINYLSCKNSITVMHATIIA